MSDEIPHSVLWLDPGKTSGWASLTSYEMPTSEMSPTGWSRTFTSGQCTGILELGRMLERCNHPAIGWEAYLGSGGTAGHAHEAIGVARYLTLRHGWRQLGEVPASSRVIATDHVLKSLQWYRPGQGHANDAARHLVAWLLREGHWTQLPTLHEVFTNLLR